VILVNSDIRELVSKAFTRSCIYIEDKPLEKFQLINDNSELLLELLNGDSNKRGVILHSGTNLFLYLSVLIATYSVYLSEESDNSAFLQELRNSDLVIYGDKRGKYRGIDTDGRIVIESVDKGVTLTTYIPEILFYKLKPYYGNAKTLDGRGIKKGSVSKYKFLASLFDIKMNQMKSTYFNSIVVVCDKTIADEFIGAVSISVDNRKSFAFSELFPAAYYNSNGEAIPYPGNSTKQEPIVKFTSKLSLARELIIEDRKISTLVVNGSQYFLDSTELSSIYTRKSLKSLIMLGELAKSLSLSPESYENIDIYAWTREAAKEKLGDFQNTLSSSSLLLHEMITSFVKNDVKVSYLGDLTDSKSYIKCKKLIMQIHREGLPQEVEQFIIRGYSLINHVQKSIFLLDEMENAIDVSGIHASSPRSLIRQMKELCNKDLSAELICNMFEVISILEEMISSCAKRNPKFEALKEIVASNLFTKKRIAVVVTKSYYTQIFIESLPKPLIPRAKTIDFFTPNKFNTASMYDEVVFFSVSDWDVINPYCISNAHLVRIILYENEKSLYYKGYSIYQKRLDNIERKNKIISRKLLQDNLQNDVAASYEQDELNFEEQMQQVVRNSMKNPTKFDVVETIGKQRLDVVRIALLESGDYVYFTRHYSAYVFDEDRQLLVESNIRDLKPSDFILFTKYDSETKDIVEKIMIDVIEENKCTEYFKICYRKCLQWKRILKAYMNNHNLSYKELSEMLYNVGKGKHEATLRAWLDEDSHIVGPRDSESYYAIAILTDDAELLEDPDSFHEASKEVRSMRIRILRFITSQILKTFGRTDTTSDDLFKDHSDEISKMSILLQIESISDVKDLTVPVHMVNRPIAIN